MKVGSLVKMKKQPHTTAYPTGMGVVTHDPRVPGTHDAVIYVTWPSVGEERPVNVMFLEALSESG